MKNTLKKCDSIINFRDYNKIPNQYTNDFIKASGAVIRSITNNEVTVAVKESKEKQVQHILHNFHESQKVNIVKVSNKDFEEFVGSIVEKSDDSYETKNNGKYIIDDSSSSSIINIINSIFLEAVRNNASDIHLEPFENSIIIRFRIDGVLEKIRELPISISESLVNRLKVMANLNIMESRIPQDGHIQITIDSEKYDVRFSTVPIIKGESVVLRLFNTKSKALSLEELGFSENNLKLIKKIRTMPNGIVLFTGPTGSGKTTTMHALLQIMDVEHKKVITIEDPVEKSINGINQIQVHEEIGLTFQNILQRVLRQDPDIIMIGEIRNKETAELALRASLTGHLVLATLHTNDSQSCVERLKNFGLDSFMISSVLRMAISQRLVRKISKDKRGYKGRTVVSEVFCPNSSDIKRINQGECLEPLQYSLKDDGIFKVKQKITSNEELKREGIR